MKTVNIFPLKSFAVYSSYLITDLRPESNPIKIKVGNLNGPSQYNLPVKETTCVQLANGLTGPKAKGVSNT